MLVLYSKVNMQLENFSEKFGWKDNNAFFWSYFVSFSRCDPCGIFPCGKAMFCLCVWTSHIRHKQSLLVLLKCLHEVLFKLSVTDENSVPNMRVNLTLEKMTSVWFILHARPWPPSPEPSPAHLTALWIPFFWEENSTIPCKFVGFPI